jgi:hypothetical protein
MDLQAYNCIKILFNTNLWLTARMQGSDRNSEAVRKTKQGTLVSVP